MEHSRKAIALALLLALTACGGGGGGDQPDTPVTPEPAPAPDPDPEKEDPETDPEPEDPAPDPDPDPDPIPDPDPEPEPPENSAPVAYDDYSTTVNDEAVTIAVLDNDSDADEDTLSLDAIIAEAENGTAELDGNTIVYTPAQGYYGADSFSYRVSDGSDTAEGRVNVTVGQQVVIEGVVADAMDTEVRVSLRLGDDEISTTTDADGNYALDTVITAAQDILQLEASIDDDTPMKLLTTIGSSDTLIGSVSDVQTRALTGSQFENIRISYLTTAAWLYYQKQLQGDAASMQGFHDFRATLSFEQLLDTASFIKVLATESALNMPEGMNTLTFFTESDESVDQTILSFLSDSGVLSETGEVLGTYAAAFNNAREAMISNSRITQPIVNSEVEGLTWAQIHLSGAQPSETDKTLTFNTDAPGRETGLWSDWKVTRVEDSRFEWTLVDGTLGLQYQGNVNDYEFACDSATLALFSNEGQRAAEQVCLDPDVDTLTGTRELRYMALRKVVEIDGVTHFQAVSDYEYTLDLTDDERIGESFTAENEELDVRSYAIAPTALDVTSDMLTERRWSLNVPSKIDYYLPDPGNQFIDFSGYFADLLEFSDSGTFISGNTDETGSWTLGEDGVLNLDYDGQNVTIVPFHESRSSLVALVTVESGSSNFSYVSEMVDEDTSSLAEFELEHELPTLWSSLSHCPIEDCLTFGKMKARKFAGFAFASDKTMSWVNADSDNEAFVRASPESIVTWERDGNFIRIDGQGNYDGDTYLEYRTWELLKVTDDGMVKVIERYAVHVYYEDDRLPSEAFIYKPHIETLRLVDLTEEYPAMWLRTDNNGGL